MSAGFTPWPAADAARYRAAGYWTGQTLGDMVRCSAHAAADHEALIDGSIRWSYAELDAQADAVAYGLHAAGLRAGERLVLHLPTSADFVRVLLGCLRAGVVPVMALPAHRASEIAALCETSAAAALVTSEPLIAASEQLRTTGAAPDTIILAADDAPAGCHTLAAIVAAGKPSLALPALTGSDLALLQLSGGTTGRPKLIPRTHDDYRYSVQRSAECCGLRPASRYLAVLPAAHNFPLSSPGILGTFAAGGTVVLCPSPDPATALPLIERERITITSVVPPLALAWLDAAPSVGADLSSLEVLQVGGARFEPSAAARVGGELGCTLQQVFGMAEGLVSYTRLDDAIDVIVHTQGRPMSGGDEVRIVDAADRDVPPGETGALLTRGPYTIRGYWRAAEHNADAFTADGFYRTGDLVRQRPSGHLVVVGRSKDQINRGGEKVAPSEIEDHLLAHPGVQDVCVLALPDPQLGERIWAVVIPQDGAENPPTPPMLRRFVRGRGVAAFKVPDRITFVAQFPTTGVGKVSRRDLRVALAEQLTAPRELPPGSSSTTPPTA
jgi:2,3-dihydroxybenzoate-AMP ligase